MVRLMVYCEGETEEAFINGSWSPYYRIMVSIPPHIHVKEFQDMLRFGRI